MTSAVEMKGITKTFPGVVANDEIDFILKKGEVHGLLGENGAGKTVLMNVLYGLYQQDRGQIFVNGNKVEIDSPSTAIKLGIGMVHQNRSVCQNALPGARSCAGRSCALHFQAGHHLRSER